MDEWAETRRERRQKVRVIIKIWFIFFITISDINTNSCESISEY